jgi:hypothetical protein
MTQTLYHRRFNEDVDVIQMITPEEFIKEHMQVTTESVSE